jgi:hypothetical protein
VDRRRDVERRADQALEGARAGGLHARTLEVLDQRGVAGRFLSQGQTARIGSFAGVPLDLSDFPDAAQLRAGAADERRARGDGGAPEALRAVRGGCSRLEEALTTWCGLPEVLAAFNARAAAYSG